MGCLEHNVHKAFGEFQVGIETKMENDICRYFNKTFCRGNSFSRIGVGNGTELHFSTVSGHKPPSLEVRARHLAVCTVASACGVEDVFQKAIQTRFGHRGL